MSKKNLITGASTGFGNITAKLLAENGHTEATCKVAQ